jgi:hypothetical protein
VLWRGYVSALRTLPGHYVPDKTQYFAGHRARCTAVMRAAVLAPEAYEGKTLPKDLKDIGTLRAAKVRVR